MKNEYYNCLISNKLSNVLIAIPEVSYSQKLKILQVLLSKYDRKIVEIAFNEYKQKFIDCNRIQIPMIMIELNKLCRFFQMKEE